MYLPVWLAGPAPIPLMKVMNLVALLIMPVVMQPLAPQVRYGVTAAAALLIALAVFLNRSGKLTAR